MKRIFAISLLIFISSFNAFAWQINQDTLLQNLKGATDFIKTNDAFYIVESEAHRVLKADNFGNILETYGNRGSGDYQFDKPTGIATSTGLKIYISDTGNNRIQVFDKRWQYLSSIVGSSHFKMSSKIEPTHLSVNNFGEVIFYDRRSKSLAKYDEDGAFLDQIPLPSQVKSVSGLQTVSDKIFVLDSKSGFVHRLSENGFYETFYKAEKSSTFYFKDEILYLTEGENFKAYSKQETKKFFGVKTDSRIQKLLIINDKVYILTNNDLVKLFLSK